MLPGCAVVPSQTMGISDPLPSWNEGEAKARVLSFVSQVTDQSGDAFVPVEARIAVFDHDGTLMIEQPDVVQFEFIYERIRYLAEDHPEWTSTQPYQAILADDKKYLSGLNYGQKGGVIVVAQTGITHEEFTAAVQLFLNTAKDLRFSRRYTQLVYQPMIELIRLLHSESFQVYVVSGGGIDFIRAFSEEIYAIPKDHVVGSSWRTSLEEQDNRWVVMRKPGFNSLNVGKNKPLNIHLHVGRRPILAVGNSDGDIQMLQYTSDQQHSLVLLLQHDDARREYEYLNDSVRSRETGIREGWQVISMEQDFSVIFAEE